jgi:cytoskeletal protein CcmA (bactofilin family)
MDTKGAIMLEKTTGFSIIDKGLKVQGILSAEGKLIIGGAVEGTLIGDEVVIAPGSRVVAQARVREMVISGYFEGEVRAYGSLRIMPTGRFCGHIVCKSLSLQAGGTLNGSVKSLAAEEDIAAVGNEGPSERVRPSPSQIEAGTARGDVSDLR